MFVDVAVFLLAKIFFFRAKKIERGFAEDDEW